MSSSSALRCLLVVIIAAVSRNVAVFGQQQPLLQCVPVSEPSCMPSQSFEVDTLQWSYNATLYPNLLGARSAVEVTEHFHALYPLIKTGCSRYIRRFACALHQPACTPFGLVPPCRELCEVVRDDCYETARTFEIWWSDRLLDCSHLPYANESLKSSSENVESIGHQSTLVSRSASSAWDESLLGGGMVCIPPSDVDVVPEAVKKHLASTNPPPSPSNVSTAAVEHPDLGIWCPAELRAPPTLSGYRFMGMENCSAPCPNMYMDSSEIVIVRYFLLTLAIICSLVSFFILLTFAIDTKRFRYPERPIIFYSASYFVVSSLHVAGFFIGQQAACNNRVVDDNNEVVQGFSVVEGVHRRMCTSMFMLLYFFTVKGMIWWVILTFTWLLAAAFKWGNEPIEKYASHYHAVAWLIPALQTSLVLLIGKVEGDNVTGLCYVGVYDSMGVRYLLLLPMCAYLLIGIVILFTGFFCLNRVRQSLTNDEENKKKLAKFMLRIGIFSFLFILPQCILIAVYVFEELHRDSWEAWWYARTCYNNGVPCPANSTVIGQLATAEARPQVFIFFIKYGMTLVVALPPLFWVAGRKTCNSWLSLPTNGISCGDAEENGEMNNTRTCLLSEANNGPHSRDVKEKLKVAEADVFSQIPNADAGSSISVVAARASKAAKNANGWGEYIDGTSSSSSGSYYSETDSSLSSAVARDMRKHGGERVMGRRKIVADHHRQPQTTQLLDKLAMRRPIGTAINQPQFNTYVDNPSTPPPPATFSSQITNFNKKSLLHKTSTPNFPESSLIKSGSYRSSENSTSAKDTSKSNSLRKVAPPRPLERKLLARPVGAFGSASSTLNQQPTGEESSTTRNGKSLERVFSL